MILNEYFWLLTKKLKFNVDKIKKPLKAHVEILNVITVLNVIKS